MPHAGWIYSRKVADKVMQLFDDSKFESVWILGPAHRVFVKGYSSLGTAIAGMQGVCSAWDLLLNVTRIESFYDPQDQHGFLQRPAGNTGFCLFYNLALSKYINNWKSSPSPSLTMIKFFPGHTPSVWPLRPYA